ncbi:hypothetical protein K504DRAFT_524867 [Pleomassaria siparia CBS 279.74]|uniref:Protein kinase domain-containing protein n=1 Tax=Pleomassaria siparia CBS 279.74 TaxID=1314801 RepID=A0A6G1KAY2_9PLEO|nr:hypothetical protein K504DRAFT_524867 [Pleomassaria siparia CBS 279.74]
MPPSNALPLTFPSARQPDLTPAQRQLAMASSSRVPWPAINEVYTFTSKKYIPIALAGTGVHATVYLCLPSAFQTSTSLPHQLVAVKIPEPDYADRAKREVPALMRVGSAAGKLTHHFPDFLEVIRIDESDSNSDPRYLTITAIHGASLSQFSAACDPSRHPEELVLHVYLQLASLIQVLQTMWPAIAHGDLHPGNLMLDQSRQDVPGFPNVVLIDFSCVDRDPRPDILRHEIRGLCKLVRDLATQGRECYPESHFGKVTGCDCETWWVQWIRWLNGRWMGGDLGISDSDAEVLKEAERRRNEATVETKENIKLSMERAMGKIKGLTEPEIREALVEGGYLPSD